MNPCYIVLEVRCTLAHLSTAPAVAIVTSSLRKRTDVMDIDSAYIYIRFVMLMD